MSIQTALARGRVMAESLMTDTCRIRRKTGETTSGGVITPTYATVYTGPCRVQARRIAPRGREVGEAYVVVERTELQLPVAVTGLLDGDVVDQIVSGTDGDLAARVYTLRGITAKTHDTKRACELIEVVS